MKSAVYRVSRGIVISRDIVISRGVAYAAFARSKNSVAFGTSPSSHQTIPSRFVASCSNELRYCTTGLTWYSTGLRWYSNQAGGETVSPYARVSPYAVLRTSHNGALLDALLPVHWHLQLLQHLTRLEPSSCFLEQFSTSLERVNFQRADRQQAQSCQRNGCQRNGCQQARVNRLGSTGSGQQARVNYEQID